MESKDTATTGINWDEKEKRVKEKKRKELEK